MQSLNHIIKDTTVTTVTTGINKVNTTVNNCTTVDVDNLYEELKPLVNDSFKPWYCQKFYKIGVGRTLELASIAKADGKNPARLFSYLLKLETNNNSTT